MTSVQASGPRIAVPFHIMPPAPSSCRYHEGYRSAANPPPPLMPISYCNSYGSCTAIPTQCAHCPSGTTFESMEKIVPPSDSALSLQTDPEMYALRNVMSTHAAKLVDSAEYRHYSYPSLQTIPPMALKRNDRLAYVEALVDTNAHVIETIWSPTASRYVKSAVVPLRMFIQEVLKRSRTTYSTLQTALFYLFRARPALLAQLYGTGADRKQEQWQDAYINCGRRMFLASLVVASKFVQDKTYRNSAWAKIAGLPVAEINAAERIFLELIDYRLYIAQSTFEQWHHLLHMHVEARARSEPVSYLQDLSYLPIGMQLPPPPPPPPTHLQQPSLPSPTSPQHTEHIASTNTHSFGSPCNILHCLPDPYGYMSHHAHTGRKRRLRETSWTDEKQHSTVFNPISPVSPNYANVATAVSPTHSGSVPPMLSLSLPSSISSSPMHTPTQVSPMRMNIGNWKTGTSPTVKHAVAAHCDLQHNLVLKKRRIADNEYPSHQGYAVSHVRGLSKRRQQRKDRQ